jgi:FeS assembly SUF system protein
LDEIVDPDESAEKAASGGSAAMTDSAGETLSGESSPGPRSRCSTCCSCYDPEIPVNIYELGLVYRVHTTDTGDLTIDMTLTSPACPVAGSLPPEVEDKVAAIPGVTRAQVNVVWDPPWIPEMMTEAAKLELNIGW